MPMTVSPSPARPAVPLVSLLWVGSLSEPWVCFTSFGCSRSLGLLSSSTGAGRALHRPADAWNLWSGTWCYSTFSIISTLFFCLGWCRRNAEQHAGLNSFARIHQAKCVRAAGLQLPFLADGSEPQFHRVTDTHYVILENVGIWLSNVSKYVDINR